MTSFITTVYVNPSSRIPQNGLLPSPTNVDTPEDQRGCLNTVDDAPVTEGYGGLCDS